ncbi:MAG TPA: ankyrin repeat domain-containing protein [Chthonomonadaceae bacterium]|nr:ankyrin repeat domain-containing protein [Chthonomonadaceae bacterium]
MKHRISGILLVILSVLVLLGLPFGMLWREAQQQQRDYALLTSIRNKEPWNVAILLKQGSNPNIHDNFAGQPTFWEFLRARFEQLRGHKPPIPSDGPPALLLAVQSDNIDSVKLLLAKGAREVDARMENGEALLIMAAKQHNFAIVRELIEHNADVRAEAPDSDCSLLTYVAASGQIDLAQMILARGADVNSRVLEGTTPLFAAAEADDLPMVKLLLANGANVNIKNDWDFEHSAALSMAADKGNLKMVQLLLDHGANVNSAARFGSALTHAALNKNIAIVRLLLAHRADPNIGDYHETLPMLVASEGDTKIMKLLLDAGADIHATGHAGATALSSAAFSGNVEMVRLVVSHGADVNNNDDWRGRTAIMAAAEYGHYAAVDYLLRHGAKINVRSHDEDEKPGDTALTLAAREGHLDVLKLLLARGARRDLPGPDGKTVLMCACEGSNHVDDNGKSAPANPKVVAYLIQRGEKVNARTPMGETALSLAEAKGFTDVARILKQAGAKE